MKGLKNTHKDYIGIYPNVVTEDFCKKVLNKYNFNKKSFDLKSGKRFLSNRQETEHVLKMEKEDETLFLTINDCDYIKDFHDITWQCYKEYQNFYPALTMVGLHKMDDWIRLQKTKVSQGYHIWHSDGGAKKPSDRVLAIILYLNNVKEGGETEFLYQKIRIKPKQGTLIIFPTSFQYIHRGNPPLSGDKYILTSWLKFV
jgi:hypothetical protein